MPAVVGYWQLPEDEKDFLKFLISTSDIMAMPDRWKKTREELAPRPILSYIEQEDPTQLSFAPVQVARQVVIWPREHEGEKLFSLGGMEDCLIGYRRGRTRDGNKLGLSNLSAYWNYSDKEAHRMVPKDPEFLKWGKKVFAWARKHTPERLEVNGYPYRATQRAKEAAAKGLIEPVLY